MFSGDSFYIYYLLFGPLNALSHECNKNGHLCVFLKTTRISAAEKVEEIIRIYTLFKLKKRPYLPYYLSKKYDPFILVSTVG